MEQPVIMPKADLVPLTGGYRRIPVMPIGADIYCDSQLIIREIDRRFTDKPLFPVGNEGFAIAIEQWCDNGLFQSAVVAIFGSMGDAVDPAFIKGREALSGRALRLRPRFTAVVRSEPIVIASLRRLSAYSGATMG